MTSPRRLLVRLANALALSVTVLSWYAPARAVEPAFSKGKVLLEKYAELKAELKKNHFGLPIHVESKEQGRSLHGEVFGVVHYPYARLGSALESPASWCGIAPLDPNIKACTFRNTDDQCQLTLYSGRKYYQPPEEVYQLKFRFNLVAGTPEYMGIFLAADKGPLRTTNYRILFEAVPLDGERTFVHFSYAYRNSLLAEMLTGVYFATLGHDKKGFTVVGRDENGDPEYVGGVRGAVERNAVRYYLALLAYLDTMALPADQRFEKRMNEWFDLTARYPLQLYEMDREQYLADKRREHRDQLRLQDESDRSGAGGR